MYFHNFTHTHTSHARFSQTLHTDVGLITSKHLFRAHANFLFILGGIYGLICYTRRDHQQSVDIMSK